MGALAFASVALASIALGGNGMERSGFDTSCMDRRARPGNDFYAYANGDWESRTPIPADRASVGTIGALDDRSRDQVHAILEEASRDPASRMGIAFRTFLDLGQIDRVGLTPVAPLLARLRAISTSQSYVAAAGEAGRRGVALPIDFKVEPDDGDPDHYALVVSQSGLGMPDRDYYLSDAPAMQQARDAYRRYLGTTLSLAGVSDTPAAAERLLAFETAIAKVSWTAAASRDAQRTYNPTVFDAAGSSGEPYPLSVLIHALGFRTGRAIIRQPDAVAGILRLMGAAEIETLRNMLIVRTMHRYAEVLPADIRDSDFAFYGRVVDGTATPEPRWRKAAGFVLDAMPDDISKIYVARHFSAGTRAAAQAMVDDLIAAFGRRIDAADWMTPVTKIRARRKLASFKAQIGYPGRWHDYAGLVMRQGDAFGNAERAAIFQHDWEAAKVGRHIYRWEWSATPMTVDAFANYPKVSIVFPAAILQPPFFDPHVDSAVNYGGIGASIAHEMTHHFDDQGANYDESGRLRSWWSPGDRTAFEARTAKLAAQYDAYTPLAGLHVNGRLTLGENIADLGGLAIAYDAYHASLKGKTPPVIDGLTGDQRFFLGWAQIWRLKYRDADLRRRLLTNPHAPAPQRVWTVRNLDAWYAAFSVVPVDRLFLRKEDRVRVW
ncbi:M13 family metallopeptidase [Sphingobium sp. Sx8-8]|uniref:M13 family metallopeptidase n=1 Tax=Sphingobium sp. Sx8-8 TaxID=2933617 RepID=UPI001F57FD7F|nr:M13 family metallopeptidase [Sphingobium sp. Sx8-8]